MNRRDLLRSGAAPATVLGAALLTPLSGSNTDVVAQGGTTARSLAARFAETINVKDHGAVMNGTADDTAAFLACLTIATTNPGTVIYMPPGALHIATTTLTTLVIPTNTSIIGAGMHRTNITWFDNESTNLFVGPASGRAADVVLRDFTITGTWATRGNTATSVGGTYNVTGGLQGFPICIENVDGLTIQNVCSQYSRIMGIRINQCTEVLVSDCSVRFTGRDGINVSYSTGISIVGNKISHTDDDGIAAHSGLTDVSNDQGAITSGARSLMAITGNTMFDTQGINCLGARSAIITGNALRFYKAHGISVQTTAAGGGSEGNDSAQSVVISGNVLNDGVSISSGGGVPGIFITGYSARAGSLDAIPGDGVTASAKFDTNTVINPYPYAESNSEIATVAVGASKGIIVSNNIIERIVPPCDGTVSGFAAVTNYPELPNGLFTRTGWYTGSLSLGTVSNNGLGNLTDYGVTIVGGMVSDVLITGNRIAGQAGGLFLSNSIRYDNIVFKGNQVIDFVCAGVFASTYGRTRAYIEDNIFDGDPYFQSALRSINGTWINGPTQLPAGIVIGSAGGGLTIRRNLFKNLYRVSFADTSQPSGAQSFYDNVAEAWPNAIYFDGSNRGIGYIDPEGGLRYSIIDGAPADGSFETDQQPATDSASAMPTSGLWVTNRFIRNTAPSISSGKVLLGWLRLTTGGGNTVGTDWTPIYGMTS